jgi:hypothetical protein
MSRGNSLIWYNYYIEHLQVIKMVIQDINIIKQAIANVELEGLILPQETKDLINSKMKSVGFIHTTEFLKLITPKKRNEITFSRLG